MRYTPTPEEARYLSALVRADRLTPEAAALAERLDPPKVTVDQAREAVGRLRQWRDAAPRDEAAVLLNLFIDQHDEAKK